MMKAYLSWNKEVTANVKVCEDTLTPQPEMRRPAPATKARASHCQNAKPYQMISRSLVTCTAQINNIHVVIKPAHCALCSLTFLIFFHFWYCGIEESSRGSSCPHPILHPQQTELGFWQSMHPGTHQSYVIKSEMGLLAAWVCSNMSNQGVQTLYFDSGEHALTNVPEQLYLKFKTKPTVGFSCT